MRDELVKISESGQGAAHTALGKTQNVFCQATRGIDIRLAALDQQSAQAAFNDQLHLLCDHCRIVNFELAKQFMGIGQRSLLLLLGQLMDRMLRVRIKSTGGNKQAAGITMVAYAGGQRGVAGQQLLLRAERLVQ